MDSTYKVKVFQKNAFCHLYYFGRDYISGIAFDFGG